MNGPTTIAFYGVGNSEWDKAQSTLSDAGYSFLSIDSIDLLDNKRVDLLVLNLDPSKADTQAIVVQLKKRKQRFVMVINGTPFAVAVDQIKAAIHESRVRLLAKLAKRDFALGIICLIGIVILAFVTQSPPAKFLGVFWITVLLFEFGFFYIITSWRKTANHER